MICFDAAMALLKQHVAALGSETVALEEAAGRILAEDLVAGLASPRLTVSAMDGYAVTEAGLEPGRALRIAGEARPGKVFEARLAPGEAVRIFTGAPLPDGADSVIMQEYAQRDGETVKFAEGYGPARHVRIAGSDFAKGDILLAKGTQLGPKALVAAAAGDSGRVQVGSRPRVALLATGDELTDPGRARYEPNAIPDTISPALAALVQKGGGSVVARHRAQDDLPALEKLAGELLGTADLMVVTGGASVGERDFAKPMFAAHGLELIFDKVAIKPGKPVWLGRVGPSTVLGLPGNPTSAMVTTRLFLVPLLALLQGGAGEHHWRAMPLALDLPETGDRETFARASWEKDGLRPLGNQDSGVQGGLVRADWLIRCPPGQAKRVAGETVRAIRF
jgi:molybdopterin molybdotransferase